MLLHNIKQTIRGMLKNKTYTFLNITGFAVGFAVVITIMLFAYKEYAVNRFIPNYEKVYRLVDEGNKGTLIDNSIVPELKNMYPEIEGVVSLFHFSINGKYLDIKSVNSKDIIWVNNVISTSDNFFSMMGIKVLASKTATPFADINSLVFSKATALKMFGKVDVVDEYVEFMGQTLPISAVVEDIPTHSTLSADIYCNEKNNDLVSAGSDSPEGRYSISDIYLSLHQDANIDELLVKMNQKFPPNKSNTKNIKAQAVKDIYFSAPIDEMSYDKTGNKSLVWIFITIAILTLIMGVFNYVNFTISQQIATLKNSGIRITNGATKAQIRSYYITNVALAVSLAFVMGIVFSCILMPLFSKLLATELNPIWLMESKFVALLLGILLFVVVICSVLPVRFISHFNIQFLFGKSHFKSRKHPFKIAMTVAQVAISIILVVGLLTINKQLKYVKTADVGFDKELLVKLNLPRGYKKYDVLRDAIAKLPFVDNLSYTAYAPGGGSSGGYINPRSEDKIRVNTIVIDNQFIETFGMKLTHGTKLTETDVNRSCYISEATYKRLEGKYEGQKFGNFEIKGVLNDININSLHSSVIPLVYIPSNYYSVLNVKLRKGNTKQQLQDIEKVWNKATDGAIFNYSFYDDYYSSLYQKEERQAQAITIFAIIAFIITCLGLLSQVLQNTQNRIKEIGIRKINGASIKEVMLLLNKEFLWTVAIAFVIATPIAYYAMNKWLENFAYKTALSWWIFALAGLSALVIALLTVSWQSYRAASRNPVEALRYE